MCTVDRSASVQSYKDLRVWQDAVELAVECYREAESFPLRERFGLARQIRNASTSIAANIAEGHRRGGRRAYLNFLNIAAGSHGELETRLEIALRVDLLSSISATMLKHRSASVGRQLTRLIQVVRSQSDLVPRP